MEEYRTPDERAARALEMIAMLLNVGVKLLAAVVGIILGQVISNALFK